MRFLAELDADDLRLGGKARSLAKLATMGFATPNGFVVTDALFRAICPRAGAAESHAEPSRHFDHTDLLALKRMREDIETAPWPDGFREELHAKLRDIGDVFSVRSSFASEDMAGALAAGVYESRVRVPVREVETAIRHVLCSAVSPGAAAYATVHGARPAAPPVAVLVHAYIAAQAAGSAAFAPDVVPEPVLMIREGLLSDQARAELRAVLAQLAGAQGPVEIEWVVSSERVVYLQARPYQPKPAPAPWEGWRDLPEEAGSRDTWRWDAAHNPLPLSPAQAGLVDFVDERCRIGIRQRVLGGYLFYVPDARPLPAAIEDQAAADYFEALHRKFEACLTALGSKAELEDTLLLFADVYQRIFGVLQPALKRPRQRLQEFLRTHAPEQLALLPALCAGVPSVAEERRRLARTIRQAKQDDQRAEARAAYLTRFGDEASVWDVVAPTYAEDPAALSAGSGADPEQRAGTDWQGASAAVEARLSQSQRDAWRTQLSLAREAISLSEADDWLYARAQAAVRRALLRIGQGLQSAARLTDASDVFFVPLALLRNRGHESGDLAALATAGRAAWEFARRSPPPAAIVNDDHVVRGYGTGGHAMGRIVVHASGVGRAIPSDAVLFAQTLLPTELPLVSAAAIVTETGGPLDHVAAQARERGIPAVIGASGAGALLREGDLALVDGDRGLVVKLQPGR